MLVLLKIDVEDKSHAPLKFRSSFPSVLPRHPAVIPRHRKIFNANMSAPPPIQVSNTGTGPSSPLRNQVPEDAVDELGPSRSQSVLSMKRLSYQRPPLRQSMHGHNSSVTSRTASLHEASVEDIGLVSPSLAPLRCECA